MKLESTPFPASRPTASGSARWATAANAPSYKYTRDLVRNLLKI
jgi:hypothetical protein